MAQSCAMGIKLVSGLVWKKLLKQSKQFVQTERENFAAQGLSAVEIERSIYWDALAVKTMAQWRKVHIPIFIMFAVLVIGHIFSIFLFWGWAWVELSKSFCSSFCWLLPSCHLLMRMWWLRRVGWSKNTNHWVVIVLLVILHFEGLIQKNAPLATKPLKLGAWPARGCHLPSLWLLLVFIKI